MIAVARNSDTGLLASLDKSSALLDPDLFAIDGDLDFGGESWGGCECSPGCCIADSKASGCRLQAPQYPLSHHVVWVGLREEGGEGGGGVDWM